MSSFAGRYIPPGMPERPDDLTPEARRAWDAIAPMLSRRGILAEIDGTALAHFCAFYVRYLDVRAAARGLEGEARSAMEREASQWRLLAREMAAAFLLIPRERVPLGPLDADGGDAELRRWFTPASGPAVA